MQMEPIALTATALESATDNWMVGCQVDIWTNCARSLQQCTDAPESDNHFLELRRFLWRLDLPANANVNPKSRVMSEPSMILRVGGWEFRVQSSESARVLCLGKKNRAESRIGSLAKVKVESDWNLKSRIMSQNSEALRPLGQMKGQEFQNFWLQNHIWFSNCSSLIIGLRVSRWAQCRSGSHGFTRVHTGSHGFTRVHTKLHGCTLYSVMWEHHELAEF